MPALVEKDNRLIRHCRVSKYKIGPVIGMRVPLYIEEEPICHSRKGQDASHERSCSSRSYVVLIFKDYFYVVSYDRVSIATDVAKLGD